MKRYIPLGAGMVLGLGIFMGVAAMSHLSLSSLYPCEFFKLIDYYCIPTPTGYLKSSNGTCIGMVEIPQKPWIEISFPFAENHPVCCSQGNASAWDRTHFYNNTLYAVDLYSLDDAPAGEIYAVLGGTAVVEDGCTHVDCRCYGGFGNNVRIIHDDGETYALYAHLSSVNVKTGERITEGQCIGVEGETGAAGGHHLHFSVHRCNPLEFIKQYLEVAEFVKKYRLPLNEALPEPTSMEPSLMECVKEYRLPGNSIPFTWHIRYEDESCYREVGSLDMKVSKKSFYGQRK